MSPISQLIKRNGKTVNYDKKRILVAIEKAFLSCNINDITAVASLADEVDTKLAQFNKEIVDVELVQDTVESTLMMNHHFNVAKNFILYRERQKLIRQENVLEQVVNHSLEVSKETGESDIFKKEVIQEPAQQKNSNTVKKSITKNR